MSAAIITVNELEGRSYTILANASHALAAIPSVAKHSRQAVRHYLFCLRLGKIAGQLEELMAYLHTPESIVALESAQPERVVRLGQIMREIPVKSFELVSMIRSADLGFWQSSYERHTKRLESSAGEASAHISVFLEGTPLVLLTKVDQDRLVESLLNPPEPNARLRRAFGR
jgi:hypothetical protein